MYLCLLSWEATQDQATNVCPCNSTNQCTASKELHCKVRPRHCALNCRPACLLQAMDLKVGETQDLLVWAFPKALETTQDTLLGRIASNPVPVEFPISCVGAKPQVEVRLDLPASVPPDAAAAAAAAPPPVPEAPKAADTKPAAVGKPAAGKGKAPPAPELPLTPRNKVLPLSLCPLMIRLSSCCQRAVRWQSCWAQVYHSICMSLKRCMLQTAGLLPNIM